MIATSSSTSPQTKRSVKPGLISHHISFDRPADYKIGFIILYILRRSSPRPYLETDFIFILHQIREAK